VTKTEIQRSGKDKIIGSFKLCINAGGAVTSVKMLKSTGFPAYDSKIQSKMNGEWKYRPYAVNGRAVPVCTAVTFILLAEVDDENSSRRNVPWNRPRRALGTHEHHREDHHRDDDRHVGVHVLRDRRTHPDVPRGRAIRAFATCRRSVSSSASTR